MRLVNASGRLGLVVDGGLIDVERTSGGQFAADTQAVYSRWAEFVTWTETAPAGPIEVIDDETLGPPAPQPRQVFAIGLNYFDHAEEAGMEPPTDSMVVFTKFPSSITGPFATIEVPPGSVDWETELVVVIGEPAYRVTEADAWRHVAGLTVGQDISERELQFRPPSPQFNLGKSFPGFSPMGPALVTPDEFADRNDIKIGCELNGEQVQLGQTGNMIFSVPRIIAELSSTLPLLAGDVIFTGTPAGIGWARVPPRLIQPGHELVTTAETIGTMRHRFVARNAVAS
ncbi:MAG: fumarylacetoacetate hydrolase family protein [Actinomycetota bacterium]|nr:fumarylacetoacetate hydrolase family protein [Actinomycetota bacterium]